MSHVLHQDSWPMEERNSVGGQRWASTTWSFLCSQVLLKYKRDSKSFWHKHQKRTEKSALLLVFQFSSVQLPSCVQFLVTPWTEACQASLSITNSQSLSKLMSIESVMPSNHLILCPPLLLPPSIFPNIRIFSNESALSIRWPTIGVSASASILMNIQD